MSSQPSPSASNRATPAPMVSGRYFLPARPLLWVKRTPEAAVTSVNRIPGCGAGAAALGAGAAAARPRAARARVEAVKSRFKDFISCVDPDSNPFHFIRLGPRDRLPSEASPSVPLPFVERDGPEGEIFRILQGRLLYVPPSPRSGGGARGCGLPSRDRRPLRRLRQALQRHALVLVDG